MGTARAGEHSGLIKLTVRPGQFPHVSCFVVYYEKNWRRLKCLLRLVCNVCSGMVQAGPCFECCQCSLCNFSVEPIQPTPPAGRLAGLASVAISVASCCCQDSPLWPLTVHRHHEKIQIISINVVHLLNVKYISLSGNVVSVHPVRTDPLIDCEVLMEQVRVSCYIPPFRHDEDGSQSAVWKLFWSLTSPNLTSDQNKFCFW